MRQIILHGHIFKNAGSTFDWSLARYFGKAFLDHREDKVMRERRGPHLAELIAGDPGLRAVSSHHLCYPLPELEDVNFSSAYLLRHPIERIASVYAFEKRQDSQSRGAIAAKEKSFTGYVAWRLQDDVPRTIRDYQTSNVAGFHGVRPMERVPVDWLRRATHHLAAIDCVGVVDRYDESMVVFEHRLSATFPGIDLSYVRQNVTPRTGQAESLGARVHETLERLGEFAAPVLARNSYDLALYRQANQKLDAALADIDDVESRLADLTRRCDELATR
jgi:hypothetical protein